MEDHMKLLRAFIGASGYDIEELTEEYKFYKGPLACFNGMNQTGTRKTYRVTKNKPFISLRKSLLSPFAFVPTKEWACIVDFVISHREDIINDKNDYGGLRSILEFMERDKNE